MLAASNGSDKREPHAMTCNAFGVKPFWGTSELFLICFYLRSQSRCYRGTDKTAADRSNCTGHETGEVSEHFIDHIKQVFITYAGEHRRDGSAAHFF